MGLNFGARVIKDEEFTMQKPINPKTKLEKEAKNIPIKVLIYFLVLDFVFL